VVIALPLTKETKDIIGREELRAMKKNGILVNIGRAEVVNEPALYEHLVKNPEFSYATDVWWFKDGAEDLVPELPFLGLRNFIGTPHVSGPSAAITIEPTRVAIKNIFRYLTGRPLLNVIDRADYI